MMQVDSTIDRLLASGEPAIVYKTRVNVLGEDPSSGKIRKLQKSVRESQLVKTLLRHRDATGRIAKPGGVYGKWQGAHWIMAILADIGYPRRDRSLYPVRDQLQDWWLGDRFYDEFIVESKSKVYGKRGVPVMQGRHRRCASQQSNALWSIMRLELENERTHDFVERLLHWQWPDGGWNCDKNPDAHHSSYMESVLPLRALALYGETYGDKKARAAARKAKEIFLKRHLYRRQADGKPIKTEFTQLHYPLYWHYDILHGLKVLAESGFIRDRRCKDALDLLESKQTEDGGWPAEKKYYKASDTIALGNDYVDWGGTSKKMMNPWVTVDALYVLKEAGRIKL